LRLFLAINLPAEVRREVLAATAALRNCAPDVAWVGEERLHLTLKFLGEQDAGRLPEIEAAVARVAGGHRELLMSLGGVSAFPNFRRARVVWMGVLQEPRLELLHHDVEVACEALGFELEGRAFRPHITLARIRTPLHEDRLKEMRRTAKLTDYRGEFIVRSIEVMQSDLSADATVPSRYTTLVAAALRSG
jgi:RNA 2',3'-cyclic 3'-phosphodiesterase